MTSKTVAALLSDLEVTRSHSRPRVSNDNPYSEAWFKSLKFAPQFPERFGSLPDARAFMDSFVEGYNHTHRHTGIGLNTPADVHYGLAAGKALERTKTLAAARAKRPERFTTNNDPKILAIPDAAWINKPAEKNHTKAAASLPLALLTLTNSGCGGGGRRHSGDRFQRSPPTGHCRSPYPREGARSYPGPAIHA
jgi:putative transposase